MEYKVLGKSGLRVSEICLGTMTFGNEASVEEAVKIMDYAYEIGINFIDTAHNYNKGVTEEIIGKWIGNRRKEIILATKVFFPSVQGVNREGLSKKNILISFEESLGRLNTDYVDILYLHHWDENTEIEYALEAVNTLILQGKVLYIGISNFSAWQIMKTIEVSKKHNWSVPICIQPMYSLLKRQVEVEILPLAQTEKLGVVPYNVLGAGMLTGKYLRGESGRLNENVMYQKRYGNPIYLEITQKFVKYAREKGISPAVLAPAWVKSHPGVTSILLGARNLMQFKELVKCMEVRLTKEEWEEISALSYQPPSPTDREPLEIYRLRGW
ncbi:MAG: aldo/keto reductase [Candidatus Hydrogenedentes bacterium]|nr:aldo/keto reductase [Candidatus Hydrogenedentota bacterium]